MCGSLKRQSVFFLVLRLFISHIHFYFRSLPLHMELSFINVPDMSPVVHLISRHRNRNKLFGLNLYWLCGLAQLIRYLRWSICFLMKCRECLPHLILSNPDNLFMTSSLFLSKSTCILVFPLHYCASHNISEYLSITVRSWSEMCRQWCTLLISILYHPRRHDKQICPQWQYFRD